ncbi:MAG: septal ring lytic transglycosylase RlpA family protein [Deltaproteobacteria bacterium]|nr:septal ring lytic transglycosylase RlpA family protein [Deltaproteobacteria bacterium]
MKPHFRHGTIRWIGLIVFGLMVFSGCARTVPAPKAPPKLPPKSPDAPKPYRVDGKWYRPIANAHGFRQKGIASWYGKDFHGRKTSNGEVYNMYGLSAAHKTLPLGTWVRVRNLNTGATLDVRVNDRGPFVRGRIIDLSYAAAKKLGLVGPGTAPVEVVVLGRANPPTKGQKRPEYQSVDYQHGVFTVQVGAFRERANAERLRDRLSKIYDHAHITTYHDGRFTFYRVRVGRWTTLNQAIDYEAKLIRSGFKEAVLVAE